MEFLYLLLTCTDGDKLPWAIQVSVKGPVWSAIKFPFFGDLKCPTDVILILRVVFLGDGFV